MFSQTKRLLATIDECISKGAGSTLIVVYGGPKMGKSFALSEVHEEYARRGTVVTPGVLSASDFLDHERRSASFHRLCSAIGDPHPGVAFPFEEGTLNTLLDTHKPVRPAKPIVLLLDDWQALGNPELARNTPDRNHEFLRVVLRPLMQPRSADSVTSAAIVLVVAARCLRSQQVSTSRLDSSILGPASVVYMQLGPASPKDLIRSWRKSGGADRALDLEQLWFLLDHACGCPGVFFELSKRGLHRKFMYAPGVFRFDILEIIRWMAGGLELSEGEILTAARKTVGQGNASFEIIELSEKLKSLDGVLFDHDDTESRYRWIRPIFRLLRAVLEPEQHSGGQQSTLANIHPTKQLHSKSSQPDRARMIRNCMLTRFSLAELRELVYDLGEEPESVIPSSTNFQTALREVVGHFERRGTLDLLVHKIQAERPHNNCAGL